MHRGDRAVDAAKPPPITSRLPSGVPIYAGGDRVRSMVTQLGTPQGIVALFARPARVTVDVLSLQATRLIVAEAVDNPINVGSIVRNAVALGWHGMIFDYTSADPFVARSLRVSMGQAITFPAARSTDLPGDLRRLATDGFAVCALTPAVDAVDIGSIAITEKMCIVIGSDAPACRMKRSRRAHTGSGFPWLRASTRSTSLQPQRSPATPCVADPATRWAGRCRCASARRRVRSTASTCRRSPASERIRRRRNSCGATNDHAAAGRR